MVFVEFTLISSTILSFLVDVLFFTAGAINRNGTCNYMIRCFFLILYLCIPNDVSKSEFFIFLFQYQISHVYFHYFESFTNFIGMGCPLNFSFDNELLAFLSVTYYNGVGFCFYGVGVLNSINLVPIMVHIILVVWFL